MKTKVKILIIIGVGALAGFGFGAKFYYDNLRGSGPALRPPSADIRSLINTTGMPLEMPDGFQIEVVADSVPAARVLVFDLDGNIWVSQRGEGSVTKLTMEDGVVTAQQTMFSGLRNPHGLAFDPDDPQLLYVATEDGLWSYQLGSEQPPARLVALHTGGNHTTRTIGFGPDGRLYLSSGSTCNACVEENQQRAAISVYDPSTQSFSVYASGLRNSVFFVWKDGQMWATDNGRDLIGDDIPPDEINVVEEGKFYGWPYCYGQNVQDTHFDASTGAASRCENAEPSRIDLQAHSAALGLGFIPADQSWPSDWVGDLLVAYHGSWNRTIPTGYKIVRLDFDEAGGYIGTEDFITGWLTDSGALGRPVDVTFYQGALYVSDDKAGVIYRVKPLP